MTIDEAIKHAEEVAEEHTKYNRYGGFESCDECAEEHRQLAKWLKELKQLKEQTKKGHWIDYSEEGFVECPECGIGLQDWHRVERNEDDDISFHEYEFKYCPNCGAEME